MKGCMQWDPIYSRKDFHLQWESKPGPITIGMEMSEQTLQTYIRLPDHICNVYKPVNSFLLYILIGQNCSKFQDGNQNYVNSME